MEIIITEDCSFKSEFEPIKNKIAEYFSKLSNLSTLKKVIITDHDFNNYSKSVKELSRDIEEYSEEAYFDEDERSKVEERLDIIYMLKRK